MLARTPMKIVTVALANCMAQTIWAAIAKGICDQAAPAHVIEEIRLAGL